MIEKWRVSFALTDDYNNGPVHMNFWLAKADVSSFVRVMLDHEHLIRGAVYVVKPEDTRSGNAQ